MCGIAGTLDLAVDLGPAEGLVASMTDMLAHRGPDDAGLLVDGPITFGHRRLSIIDLSAAGHQPMGTQDGRHWITYNGEIYNYVELRAELESLGRSFRTQTDTEVLLAALAEWGIGALNRLNGMFAFALWDRLTAELLLARDRFGVKPLYFCEFGGRLRFASEIKALFVDPAVPRGANLPRLAQFLAYGLADHTEETMFAGVYQLRPGSCLVARPHVGITERRAWYRPGSTRLSRGTNAPRALRSALERAVSIRLRSDVPVGVALSGGMDSTTILALAASEREMEGLPSPMSFTARATESRLDEGAYVSSIVESTGSENLDVLPTAGALLNELDSLLWHMDEPFHSASVFGQRKVHELARQHGVVVALDGSGGDEALYGYHHFHYSGLLLSRLAHGHLVDFVHETRARKRVHGVQYRETGRDIAKWLAVGHHPRRPSWLARDLELVRPRGPRWSLSALQDYGLFVAPLQAYNHHSDRNSMTFSLETRNPFLDVGVVELARGLRADMLLNDGLTKWALRQAVSDIVPAPIVERGDKQGFTTDEATWMRNELDVEVRRILASPELASRGLVDVEALSDAVAGGTSRPGDTSVLWRVFVVERWFRLMIDPPILTPPSSPPTAVPSSIRAIDKTERLTSRDPDRKVGPSAPTDSTIRYPSAVS